jgi:hypothetical protein
LSNAGAVSRPYFWPVIQPSSTLSSVLSIFIKNIDANDGQEDEAD